MTTTSKQPYLLRAMHEWIVDNMMTPHIVVDATCAGVVVPEQFVEDGRIVLNIAPHAVGGLDLGNEWLLFGARFGGRHFDVSVPISAVLAIYARESGEALSFAAELSATARAEAEASEPGLRDTEQPVPASEADPAPAGDDAAVSPSSEDDPERDPPSAGGRPSLRIVK